MRRFYWVFLVLENDYVYIFFYILQQFVMFLEIIIWDFDFKNLILVFIMNIWLMYKQFLSFLMFMERKEWGVVFWKSVGYQGVLKKEIMVTEVVVFCYYFVFVNNVFLELGFNVDVLRFDFVLFLKLYVIISYFRLNLEN